MKWITIRSGDGFVASLKVSKSSQGLILESGQVYSLLKPWDVEIISAFYELKKYGFDFPEADALDAYDELEGEETWL